MSPEPRIHPAAAVGFERAADVYERGRPDFPPEAVAELIGFLELGAGTMLLELGPGTGKLTRLLAPTGAQIVGIEPVAAMRATMRRTVPDADVLDAVAESLPLADRSVDAAVAAQAFHWFDGDRALAELERVLRPGSGLALVWNVRDGSVPWVRAQSEAIEPYRGDTPSHRSVRWRDAFERTAAFTELDLRSFPYEHRTTPDRVVDRIGSISFIAALPDDDRARIGDEIRSLLPPGDEIVYPYRTDVWTCRRR
jgi:SAM-dependent methyltransferase